MARDPYSAAAAGIESGMGLARQAKLDEERRSEAATARADALEQRAYQRTRDAKADERTAAQDKRQADADARQKRLDELAILDKEFADLNTEGTTLWSQYGGYDKVPEDIRTKYTSRAKEVRERRAAARRSFYQPDVDSARKEAAETWSRIEAGQMKIGDLTPDQLYKSIVVQARRPMSDFMRSDPQGPAAPVEQAALDLEAGLQTGNRDLIVRAANVLLAPELRVGVGSPGRDGSEIVEKKIVQLAPHPQDPQQVLPILEVKVRREDGSIGTYLAPVTKGRGAYATDPEAVPSTISIEAAMDRVGQLATLASFVNRPEVSKALTGVKEGKASADQFLEALGMMGVAPPKKQITRERFDLGGQIVERELDASGNIIREQRLAKTAPPKQAGGEGPTAEERNVAAQDRRLAQAVKDGLITPEEAREQRRKGVLGGGGKGQMTSPKDQFEAENKLRDEYNAQTKTFSTVRDAYGKVLAAAKEQKNGPDQTAAADIALIFAYMRMLDPNSVVREGEFATAQNAAGIPDRIRNMYNRARSGNLLNDKQRDEISAEARKVYAQQRSTQNELEKRYKEMAQRYALNPDNVIATANDPDAPDLPPQALAQLKEGQVTTFGNQQRWTLKNGRPVQVTDQVKK
jgi:hypothetical protein